MNKIEKSRVELIKSYKICDEIYQYDQLVPWSAAIEHDNSFYFERAKYLGLQAPPSCFVQDETEEMDEREFELISVYHRKFKDAEEENDEQERDEQDDEN